MRWGRQVIGTDHLPLEADHVYLLDVGGALASPLVVGSLAVHLDGLGVGSGEQALRPVVMEADVASSLAIGDEVVVEQGQAAGWVHLTFDLPPLLRAGREVRLGLSCGPSDALARLSVQAGVPSVTRRYAAAYGTVPDLSGPTDVGVLGTAIMVAVVPWAARDVTDDELADLPIDVAQAALDGSPLSAFDAAVCGWHYSNDAPPPPASAIVRTGGPLAALVGNRVRVTATTPAGPASVTVVVLDEQPFDDTLDEDISLARDAFMRIGGLWTDTSSVLIEVIA